MAADAGVKGGRGREQYNYPSKVREIELSNTGGKKVENPRNKAQGSGEGEHRKRRCGELEVLVHKKYISFLVVKARSFLHRQ
jgi:hypothetical protein